MSIADGSRVIGGVVLHIQLNSTARTSPSSLHTNPVPSPYVMRFRPEVQEDSACSFALGTQKDRVHPPGDRGTRLVERMDWQRLSANAVLS